ncbi:MAG: hypothetical protein QNJ90_13590 [Planctomycetota bacterium]|nr:hypothetical protein [Planctomycetota bacterium]
MARLRRLSFLFLAAGLVPLLGGTAQAGNSSDALDELQELDARLTLSLRKAQEHHQRGTAAVRGMPDIRKLEAEARKDIEDMRPTHCRSAEAAIEVLRKSHAKGKVDLERFEAGVERVNKAASNIRTEAERRKILDKAYPRIDEIHAKIRGSVSRAERNFAAYETAARQGDQAFLGAARKRIAAVESKLDFWKKQYEIFEKQRWRFDQRVRGATLVRRDMMKVMGRIRRSDLSAAEQAVFDRIQFTTPRALEALPRSLELPKDAWWQERAAKHMAGGLLSRAHAMAKRRCVKDISWYSRIEQLGKRADDLVEGTQSYRDRARKWHPWNGKKIKAVLEDIRAGRSKGRLKYLISRPLYHSKYIFVDPYGKTVEMNGAMRNPREFDESEYFKNYERIASGPAKRKPWKRYETWKHRKRSDRFTVYFP